MKSKTPANQGKDSVAKTLYDSDNSLNLNENDTATSQAEQGGYEKSKEPTRYGDWEIAGRCVDF